MKKFRYFTLGSLFVFGSLAVPILWGDRLGSVLEAAPWFSSYTTWGSDGRDGRSGRDGRNGIDGVDQIIYAEGASLSFDLSGSDGRDGDDGDHGEAARCPVYWSRPEYNIYGADGGNGGAGGNGGRGGNGGNVTIFYQQPQDLRNVFVDVSGGQAGAAGRGGYGGDGCDCYDNSWRVRTCEWEEKKRSDGTTYREEKCKTRTYYCRDGRDGRDGREGLIAQDGVFGKVTLVQNYTAIPSDSPFKSATVAELHSSGVMLSKNIWRSQSGLLSKLASGSKAPNNFTEYVEFAEVPVSLVWQATPPIQDFSSAQFNLRLGDRRNISVEQTGDLWLDYDLRRQGEGYEIVVNRAIAKADATQLIRQSVSGEGRDLKMTLVDLGEYADWIDTDFRVVYRTRDAEPEFREGYTYTSRYEADLTPAYFEQNGEEFLLHLGDLPMNFKYLQSGTGVEIEVIATRSFADNSTTQTITWTGILP
ncbi:hypothetical protein [[Limnothrix rosea] IAM M-220]|uniref:hypothetical protein n=1 Tax=[Limnothrix rosea] IAM M-220 TaxID=454133 RepID=UPI00095D12D3|nr:hypothetical protein [[Limnothrix rosea] IAM M-220]OKH15965.1 hypothetical protein NIES208_12350 [[Limnothrix rosea] IAM M-220]